MKKKILIGVGIIFAVMAVFAAWFLWRGDTKEIIQAADKFTPDPSWQLVEDHANPPATFCLTEVCPSVRRVWNLPTKINTRKEFIDQMIIDNTKISHMNDCFKQEGLIIFHNCSGNTRIGDYEYNFSYYGSDNSPGVTLMVTKKDK